MHSESNSRTMPSAGNDEALLQLIRQLMDELHPDIRFSRPVFLDSHVHAHSDRIHLIFDHSNEKATQRTYADLKRGVLKLAAGLQRHNLEPGNTVAIMLPTGRGSYRSTRHSTENSKK